MQPRNANHGDVPPLIDENSRVLVLGSILSPKSQEAAFYYAHPQNRFWRVLFSLFDEPYSTDTNARRKLALDNGIALWDVIESCTIIGASDASISDVKYNDLQRLISAHPNITKVFTTGGKAHELLTRYAKTMDCPLLTNAVRLPSTSPLNCAASLDKLITAYSVIKSAL